MKKLSIFLSTAFFSVILFQSIKCMEPEIRTEERDLARNQPLIRRQPTAQEEQTTAEQTKDVEQSGIPMDYQ